MIETNELPTRLTEALRVNRVHTSQFSLGWGVGDQALISVSNFLAMVILARSVSSTEFGAFSIVYAALLFALAIQNSLISVPHAVLSASLDALSFRNFTGLACILQLIFAICSSLTFVALWILATRYSDLFSDQLLIAACVSFTWQFQEFCRRVLFNVNYARGAFANDAVNYGLQTLLFIGLWQTDHLSAVSALYVMLITSVLAMILGLYQVRVFLGLSGSRRERLDEWLRIWNYAKWLVASSIAYTASSQMYLVLAGGVVGLQSAAALRVAQTLLGPTHILFRFIETSLMPIASRIRRANGRSALTDYLVRVSLLTIPAYLLGVALLLLFSSNIIAFIFGSEYSGLGAVFGVMAFANLQVLLGAILGLGVKAEQVSNYAFIASLCSAAVAFTLGIAFVYEFGTVGAAAGIALHGAVSCLVLFFGYLKVGRMNTVATA